MTSGPHSYSNRYADRYFTAARQLPAHHHHHGLRTHPMPPATTDTDSPTVTRVDPGHDDPDSREQTDQLVLRHLQDQAGPHSVVTASNRDLADALPISAATARRAVARLINAGDLELVTRGTGGRYRSRFRLRPPAPPARATA